MPAQYDDQVSLSDTSEIIDTCLCNGTVQDRTVLSCDGEKCNGTEYGTWFHAICVKATKSLINHIRENQDYKWYCPNCVKE